MEEEYKTIADYPNYSISNMGNVRNNKTGRILAKRLNNRGYITAHLPNKMAYVHKLVAQAFIPNPNNYSEIDHTDGNKTNNICTNLRWCSRKENMNNPITINKISTLKMGSSNPMYNKESPNKGKIGVDSILSKKVIQYDLEGHEIRRWDSVRDIKRELGFSQGQISGCCRGETKTAKGYIWRYY